MWVETFLWNCKEPSGSTMPHLCLLILRISERFMLAKANTVKRQETVYCQIDHKGCVSPICSWGWSLRTLLFARIRMRGGADAEILEHQPYEPSRQCSDTLSEIWFNDLHCVFPSWAMLKFAVCHQYSLFLTLCLVIAVGYTTSTA